MYVWCLARDLSHPVSPFRRARPAFLSRFCALWTLFRSIPSVSAIARTDLPACMSSATSSSIFVYLRSAFDPFAVNQRDRVTRRQPRTMPNLGVAEIEAKAFAIFPAVRFVELDLKV